MKYMIILFLLSSCSLSPCETPVGIKLSGYKIVPTVYTKKGLPVDVSNQEVDLDKIDQFSDQVENCLAKYGEKLPDNILNESYCYNANFKQPDIWRNCVVIKVVDDWSWSCDGKYQLLKDEAPIEGCKQKGFEKDPNCPCKWRSGIQGDNEIIVTPDLELYKDALVRYITSCYNVWVSDLKECAKN